MKIIFIRHGEGYHNLGKIKKKFICFGKLVSDNWNIQFPKLTAKGIKQCNDTKIKLEEYSQHIDIIYVSPLSRTLQTADIIFENRKLIALEDIRENVKNQCDFRESVSSQEKVFTNVDFTAVNDNYNYNNFESEQSISSRCYRFYLRLVNDAKSNNFKTVAVVTHGAFINSFLSLYGDKLRAENTNWFDNCEFRIYTIE